MSDQPGPGGSSPWAAPGGPAPGGQPGGYQQIPPGPQYPPTQYPPTQYQQPQFPVAQQQPYTSAYPAGHPGTVVAPPPSGLPAAAAVTGPVRVEPLPGTEFGVAYLPVAPTSSGLGIGSLVAGIGSIAVALVVGCFGIAGGSAGWGALVAGAFAVLGGLLGLGALGLGFAAVRQIRAGRGRITGRGVAISGISCGGAGVLLTAGGMFIALVALAS